MDRKFPSPRPTVVDLFCGAGGMSLGFEQAGFHVLLGVDQDGHHVATHERNFPYGNVLCASVESLTADDILEASGADREVDVLIGGPPCQGFSYMGLRDLQDSRNSLIDHFVRLVLELRPKVFVMENVPGLLSGATRHILDALVAVVEQNGFVVTKPVRVLDAADYGVPQQRRRVVVIGTRSDIGESISYPDRALEGQPRRPTVLEAIADLPEVERYDSLFRTNYIEYDADPQSEYARVCRGVEVDPTDLSYRREWDRGVCSGCLRTRHMPKSVKLYSDTPPGETVPGHKLPRLHPDGVSPTLRAGSDSAHGSYTAPRPVHPQLPRCITSREAARLHGFPDWFSFFPLKWHAYRQIGNAVCPQVARAVGQKIAIRLCQRWTRRHPKTFAMVEDFRLPEERPRSLRRVPVATEFPPVLGYLFRRAYDFGAGRLRKKRFTFADVEEAIEKTSSSLHWVRADTFLAELARSRRVKEILADVVKHGYSVRPCRSGASIGEFVPVGTAGTVDDRDSLHVRIDDLHDAVSVQVPNLPLSGHAENVAQILSNSAVQQGIWGKTRAGVDLGEDIGGEGQGKSQYRGNSYVAFVRATPRSRPRAVAVVTCKASTVPGKSKVARFAKGHQCSEAVLLISSTSRHLTGVRLTHCEDRPVEASRFAFTLDG